MPRSVEYLGRVSEAELDAEVRGLLSFDNCPSILRASGLATVMRQLGKVINTSKGSAETYQMSEPVDKIQIFLSHNWSVPRFKKFITLAVHFNWIPATVVTALVLAASALLTAHGYFPMLERYAQLEGYKDPAWREGFVCTAISFPVFLLVILFWQDILWCVGRCGPATFLDKTCIHQEDKQIMRMGIERLGAFLMRSEQMLALYTETYLMKLWTTYEVASFLSLHGASKMKVVPVRHAVLLLLSQGTCWLFSVCLGISHEFSADYRVLYIAGFFLAGYFVRELRLWESEKVVLEDRVRFFRVQECTCAIETDRAIVYENISRLMRASGTVGKHASQDAALEAFNHRVRSELMGAFRLSLGRHAFQFQHYFTMGWFLSGGRTLDMFVSLHLGLAPRYVICNCLFGATWVCGGWIIFFLLAEKLAAANIQWTGAKAFFWCLASTALVMGIAISSSLGAAAVRYRAETSDTWLALCVALPICSTILSMGLMNGWYERCGSWFGRGRALPGTKPTCCPYQTESEQNPTPTPTTSTTKVPDLENPDAEASEAWATTEASPSSTKKPIRDVLPFEQKSPDKSPESMGDVVLDVLGEEEETDPDHPDLDIVRDEPEPSPPSSWLGSARSVRLDVDGGDFDHDREEEREAMEDGIDGAGSRPRQSDENHRHRIIQSL
mmetsp:Transcript_21166/g.45908  ORF Transcript_21166/g.45908 Transcript_21166/m.45908 type:complete len:670 (+) Transcript_21166:14-2023(+)